MRLFVFLFAVLLLAAACSRPGTVASSSEPGEGEQQFVEERGRLAAEALMKNLGGQLKASLQSGGPVAALQVCQSVAQPITMATDAEFEGVAIRRTTLKPRNSANAPDEIDREILETMATAARQGKAIEPTIHWESGTARYYQPLIVQEVCLKCHGDLGTFPPELVQALSTLYPDDQATGYQLGDLRGVIRVDVMRD